MKLTTLVVTVGLCAGGARAHAGGLFLPGAGAESTSRAGASLAAADDGEALAINPAGLAKAKPGTEITISLAIIDYVMKFTRAGTYDMQTDPNATAGDHSYEGQPYPTVSNTSKPPLGLGAFQPVPVVAITSDLGGAVKGLHVAAGLYAPNAYPFRDMTVVNGKSFVFNTSPDTDAPPPTRYDIEKQTAAIEIPSLAASYRILPSLDVGGRFGLAFAQLESTVALWGLPSNYTEWIKQDGQVHLKATAAGAPSWSLGTAFRPTPAIEVAANFTSEVDINAHGTADALNGPNVNLAGAQIVIAPIQLQNMPLCDKTKVGTPQALNACVGIALPKSAQLGGRYKFLDDNGNLRGDVELDLDWENWGGASGPDGGGENNYTVTIDAEVQTVGNPNDGIALKPSTIYHGFQDTYGVRLGGSYILPMGGGNQLIIRGGTGYDTAAAKPGWLRADIDGAARTTVSAGVGYKTDRFQVDAGFGMILEGSPTNPNSGPNGTLCNPTGVAMGCAGTNVDQDQSARKGPDPTNPLIGATQQTESPVNQGVYQSHYIMFMLGAKTWF